MTWQWKSWTFSAHVSHHEFREFGVHVRGGDGDFDISTSGQYDCLPTVEQLRALVERVESDIVLRSKFIIFLESRRIIWGKHPEYQDGAVEVSPLVVDFHKGSLRGPSAPHNYRL